MINGMNTNTLRRYVKVKAEIDELIEKIHATAYLLSLLHDPQEQIKVDSLPIGYIGKMITTDVLLIASILDQEFACITQARLKENDSDNGK